MHDSIRDEIRSIEAEIHKAKLLHSIGKLPTSETRAKILDLEKRIVALAERLPQHEKDIILLRKEFGKEF